MTLNEAVEKLQLEYKHRIYLKKLDRIEEDFQDNIIKPHRKNLKEYIITELLPDMNELELQYWSNRYNDYKNSVSNRDFNKWLNNLSIKETLKYCIVDCYNIETRLTISFIILFLQFRNINQQYNNIYKLCQ